MRFWRPYTVVLLVTTALQLATEWTPQNISTLTAIDGSPSTPSPRVLGPCLTPGPIIHTNLREPCPDADCRLEGQGDLYGLGTRLGIYFTWGASLIANILLPDEYDSALDNNTVFLFALTIAVIFYGTKRQLRALDALILLQLSLGFIFTVMTVWGYRTCVYWKENAGALRRFGGVGTHVRLFILSAISGFSLWFWWAGYKDDTLLICKYWGNCRTDLRVFVPLFFHTYDLDSAIPRGFYITVSAALSLYYLSMDIAVVAAIAWRFGQEQSVRKQRTCWPTLDRQRAWYTRFTRGQFKTMTLIFLIFDIVGLAFSIAGIEMTLKENQVQFVDHDNIASYGQLLPLSIGVLALIKVAIDFVTNYCFRRPPGRKEELPIGRFKQIARPKRKPYDGLCHRILAACLPWTLLWRPDDDAETLASSTTDSSSSTRSYKRRRSGRRESKRRGWV